MAVGQLHFTGPKGTGRRKVGVTGRETIRQHEKSLVRSSASTASGALSCMALPLVRQGQHGPLHGASGSGTVGSSRRPSDCVQAWHIIFPPNCRQVQRAAGAGVSALLKSSVEVSHF